MALKGGMRIEAAGRARVWLVERWGSEGGGYGLMWGLLIPFHVHRLSYTATKTIKVEPCELQQSTSSQSVFEPCGELLISVLEHERIDNNIQYTINNSVPLKVPFAQTEVPLMDGRR